VPRLPATGIMMCAYGVPAHITCGPPLFESVGMPVSVLGSVGKIITCGPVTIHSAPESFGARM